MSAVYKALMSCSRLLLIAPTPPASPKKRKKLRCEGYTYLNCDLDSSPHWGRCCITSLSINIAADIRQEGSNEMPWCIRVCGNQLTMSPCHILLNIEQQFNGNTISDANVVDNTANKKSAIRIIWETLQAHESSTHNGFKYFSLFLHTNNENMNSLWYMNRLMLNKVLQKGHLISDS